MDETADKEQAQEESNEQSQKNEKYSGNTNTHPQRTRYSESSNKLKRNRSGMHVTSQKRQNRHSYSRSHSPHYTKHSTQWISSNAFINFIQDFRKNFTGVRSTEIYQMAGKRWRTMSLAQKQPYLSAALSNRNKNIENMQPSDTKTKENAKGTGTDKQEKVNKKERKKKKPKISPKKRTKSESDSDSMASGTTGSNTTDDFSDDSS